MLIGRTYAARLMPAQAAYADRVAGARRAVWNTGLAQRREYRRCGGFIAYAEQCRQLAEAKTDPHLEWLSELPGHCLQQALKDLDRACAKHGTWRVRFASKHHSVPTFRFPEGKNMRITRLNRRWSQVNLPKIGKVTFRHTRDLGGTIRNATMTYCDGGWHVSFTVEDGFVEATPNSKPPVGVDRGVAAFIATSDGTLADREFWTEGEQRRLLALQRRAARQRGPRAGTSDGSRGKQQAPSNRWKSTQSKIAALHAKVRRRRDDYTTQTAVHLTRNYGLIAVEDLRIATMTATAKGTTEQPGRNVRAKAGLNRAILDKGWGRFASTLQHKATYHGATVVKVNPAYTSTTCSACGSNAAGQRETQASFTCANPTCGWTGNADVNAARNILTRALPPQVGYAAGRGGRQQPSGRKVAVNGRTQTAMDGPRQPQPAVTRPRAGIPARQRGEDVNPIGRCL